ncbi:MAG: hypothetical protein ACD_20C00135G0009 [uncultured bacterium]|nr:MAG: hypothetical protein ACD_20C00135G0009 [uncultured bacterium]
MKSKLERIFEIASQTYNVDKLEVWTESYVARGTLLNEPGKAVEGIVTILDAEVYPIFNECECAGGSISRTWLNIFEDQIISFTFTKKGE